MAAPVLPARAQPGRAVPALVQVRGESSSPAASAVEAALVGLLPPPGLAVSPDVAELRDEGDLVVELRRASGLLPNGFLNGSVTVNGLHNVHLMADS